jgi:ferredoxin-type protein NapG
MFMPTVHSEHCTGCGKCEKACVTDEASIRVLPAKLVKGSLGEHYRLGWEEKKGRRPFTGRGQGNRRSA